MTKPKANLTLTQPSATELTARLCAIFEGLELPDFIQTEAVDIARQVHGKTGSLTATDTAQLRELARIMVRSNQAAEFAAIAYEAGDIATWIKVSATQEKAVGTIRGLMRDLVVTRAGGGVVESSVAKTARLKAGSDWAGVL